MKRRILLITIIIFVIVVLVLGINLYVKRNTSSRLLRRAELALSANDPQKALELINTYVVRHPDDWKGIRIQAHAQMRLGRYQDARDLLIPLLNKTQLTDNERAKILLDLNDSYAYPAQQRMNLPQTRNSLTELQAITEDFHRANEFLSQAKPTEKKDILVVHEALANHQTAIGFCQNIMADIYTRQAETADIAGNAELAEQHRQKSREFADSGRQYMEKAIQSFLSIVQDDPERSDSARRLIELCRLLNDQESLNAARSALAQSQNPPVEAIILLLRQELDAADQNDIGTTLRRIDADKVHEVAGKLERLLEQYPEEDSVRLECADMALRLGEFDRVEAYLEPILQKNPRQTQARILRARLWLLRGDIGKAEKEFFSLKSEMPDSSELHFYYGQAARANGKKELARQAMRTAANINPKDPRPRFFLAQSLLEDGFYDQAFIDAQACYEVIPGDSAAVGLLMRSAFYTNQLELLRKTVDQALREYPDNPEMLVVVAEGYRLLRDDEQLRKVMHALTQCTPGNPRETALVAGAFLFLDQLAPAENLLLEELKRHPNDPDLNYELGRLYAKTERGFQAEEYLSRALQAQPADQDRIRLELAQVLISADDPEQALHVLNDIETPNSRANLLRLQAKMIMGETLDADQVLQQANDVDPLGTALTYFYSNQLDQCAEICQAELNKNSTDQHVRILLAQTYQRQEQFDKSRNQWVQLLQADPKNMFYYFSLAKLLSRDASIQQVNDQLQAIPNIKTDQLALTIGWLYEQNRQYDEALQAYTRVVDRPGVESSLQNRARLIRARIWALLGRLDDATSELDRIVGDDNMRQRALLVKTRLQIASRQSQLAQQTLEELKRIAEQKENPDLFKNIVGLYVQLDMSEQALAICEQMVKMFPRNPNVYIQRAAVLQKLRRFDDAVADYRRAVECQPGDLSLQRRLVRALDEQRDLEGALIVLKEVEAVGQTGQSMALYERGTLFTRWGFLAQAVECFSALAQSQQGQNPRIQFVLANTFARLGRKEQSLGLLQNIPDYSNEYVPAQLLIVRLTDDAAKNLNLLKSLQMKFPARADVITRLAGAYLDAGLPDDALQVLAAFVSTRIKDASMPAELRDVIIQTLAAARHSPEALELSQQLAALKHPVWNLLSVLIALDQTPQRAAETLPPVDKAGVYDAVLGLCQARLTGQTQSAQQWAERLDDLEKQLQQLNPPQSVPGAYRLLARLALGQSDEAQTFYENNRDKIIFDDSIVQELMNYSRTGENSSEILYLLQAHIALDMGLLPFCHNIAMQTLQARPTCQWAGALLFSAQPDRKTLELVTQLLEPKNSLIAEIYQAQLCSLQGDHRQAADIFQRIVRQSPRRTDMQFRLAGALENAGQFDQALKLYQDLWRENSNPAAANNAAYMVSLLTPEDKTQLQQARQWADAAVEAAPQQVAFRETRGWIACLQGENELALKDLRQTIQVLADVPEAHYHLALAEKANGHQQYARWNFQAAVELGQKMIRDEKSSPAVLELVINRSRQALAELGPENAEDPS